MQRGFERIRIAVPREVAHRAPYRNIRKRNAVAYIIMWRDVEVYITFKTCVRHPYIFGIKTWTLGKRENPPYSGVRHMQILDYRRYGPDRASSHSRWHTGIRVSVVTRNPDNARQILPSIPE